jgi:hypothetical protein
MVSMPRKSSAFQVMPSAEIWQRFLFAPGLEEGGEVVAVLVGRRLRVREHRRGDLREGVGRDRVVVAVRAVDQHDHELVRRQGHAAVVRREPARRVAVGHREGVVHLLEDVAARE